MTEENDKNPSIACVKKFSSPNRFIIKYKTQTERKEMAEKVLQLVSKHEITDFHIQEKEAFTQTRLLYNDHTLCFGGEFSFDELDKEFFKYYK